MGLGSLHARRAALGWHRPRLLLRGAAGCAALLALMLGERKVQGWLSGSPRATMLLRMAQSDHL